MSLGNEFGSSLGGGSRSKNSRSHIKLILCCSFPIFHIPDFIQIALKTLKLIRVFVGRLWMVGPVSQGIAVVISNSFHVLWDIQDSMLFLAPKPNLVKIGWRTRHFNHIWCCSLPNVTQYPQQISAKSDK